MRPLAFSLMITCAFAGACFGSPTDRPIVQKPGLPILQVPAERLPITREFPISGEADWVAIAPGAVWAAGKHPDVVARIDPRTNRILQEVRLPGDACAGITTGTGRLWVPICSGTQHYVVAIDMDTYRVAGRIAVGPPAEGGIAAGSGSVWFTIGDGSTLMQVDAKSFAIRRRIRIAPGSYNPNFTSGHLWITSVEKNLLTDIRADTGAVVAITRVGPSPRFVTSGGGSIWTLNQGDGSVTRVSESSHKVLETIPLGIAGAGGDIDFGAQTIWVTSPGVPLTAVDAANNRPLTQWVGLGGDSLRFGYGSVWLTDFRRGRVLRVSAAARMWRR